MLKFYVSKPCFQYISSMKQSIHIGFFDKNSLREWLIQSISNIMKGVSIMIFFIIFNIATVNVKYNFI